MTETIDKISELIEEFGPEIGMPHVDTIKGKDCHGLMEMRPKGKEVLLEHFFPHWQGKRSLFFTASSKKR